MNPDRKTGIIVGILFIAGYAGIFGASAIYGPILDAPDYLSKVYPNRTRVIIGMLVELILNDIPVVGIGVLLFPIFKKHGEGIAFWYAGNRIIEAVLLIVSQVGILSLVTISREYISAGAANAAYYQSSAVLALAGRYWSFDVIHTVVFVIGALILYSILYKSKLVPRIISIWGLISAVSLIAANVLPVPDLTQGWNPGQLLYFPIMSSEILLAIWLIVRGFNPTAVASPSAN